MKKLLSLSLAIVFLVLTCGCEKISSNTDSSTLDSTKNEDIYSELINEDDNSSEIESQTESISDNTVSSNESNTITQNSKPNFSNDKPSTPTQNNTTPIIQNNSTIAKLNVDTSRSPSTDIGSFIEDGYIYYHSTKNESGFPTALLRKKINSDIEETVIDIWANKFQVLNKKVYYLLNGILYCCNADGQNNHQVSNINNISEFTVAGDWIFAIRDLGTSFINKPIQELHMIRIDGSSSIQLKNNAKNDSGSTVTIHGFNRGYCYYSITHYYSLSNAFNTTSSTITQRIDYRDSNPTAINLDVTASFEYKNMQHYSYELDIRHGVLNKTIIYYDHIFQHSLKDIFVVSMANSKTAELYNESGYFSYARTKDYFVYQTLNSNINNISLIFTDFSGNKNTINVLSNDPINTYSVYGISGHIHSNSVIITKKDADKGNYAMILVDDKGNTTTIYEIINQTN